MCMCGPSNLRMLLWRRFSCLHVERRRRHDSSVKMRQEHWLCQSSGSRWNPIEKQKLLTARYATPTILHRLLHHHNIFMYIGSDGTWEGLAPAADTCPFWISTPPSCVLDVTVFSISARCSSMASSCVLAIMSRWSSVDVSEEADEIPATYHLHRRCAGSWVSQHRHVQFGLADMHARTCARRMPTLLPLLACFFHLKYSIPKSAINHKVTMTMRTISSDFCLQQTSYTQD